MKLEKRELDDKPAVSNAPYELNRGAPSDRPSLDETSNNSDDKERGLEARPANIDHDAEEKLRQAHLNPAVIEAAHNVSPEECRRTLRRIDLFMMPFMCIAVLLQFTDKTR